MWLRRQLFVLTLYTAILDYDTEVQIGLVFNSSNSAYSFLTFLRISLDCSGNLFIQLSVTIISGIPVQQTLVFQWFVRNGFAGFDEELLC